MANAGIRRHDLEILQALLSPAEKGVALDVALHFEVGVEREGVRGAELIHLHGMVDDEFGGKQGIDFLRDRRRARGWRRAWRPGRPRPARR